jgi:YD repeat-containing protein
MKSSILNNRDLQNMAVFLSACEANVVNDIRFARQQIEKELHVIFIIAAVLILLPPTFAHASPHPFLSTHGVVFSTGNKHFSESDFSLSSSVQSIGFKRYYNSQGTATGPVGYGWSTAIAHFSSLAVYDDKIVLVEASGRRIRFISQGADTWVNETGKVCTITLTGSVYELADYDGKTRLYNSSGKMTEERDRNNNSIVFSYSGDQLSGVTDAFGQQLTFIYTNNLISTLSTPVGDFLYSYDGNNNLISIQKPDGTTRQYIYDDPADVHNLTGIVDEQTIRIATIEYDDQDRVVTSSLADGNGQVSIEYLPSYVRKITNSEGEVTTYQLAIENGVARVVSATGPGCSSCGSDDNFTYAYNARQQVEQKTDANGIITTYTYDGEGRRISRTEAATTPQERTVTWTYDPATDRTATISKASISNSGQQSVTSNGYDTDGNLTSRTESGYAGSTPISRTTGYTYDSYGRITSVDGPRTDVADITTSTYYPDSPYLNTVTNGLPYYQLQPV